MYYYDIRVMILLTRKAGLPVGERIKNLPLTEHEVMR